MIITQFPAVSFDYPGYTKHRTQIVRSGYERKAGLLNNWYPGPDSKNLKIIEKSPTAGLLL
jgi:hypothetical protein